MACTRGDVIAVVMPNDAAWFDIVWAGFRSGMYVVPINWHLAAKEAAYIVTDCEAKALFASASLADTIAALGEAADNVELRLSVGGDLPGFESLETAIAGQPATASPDDAEGSWMFYSSGTTGSAQGHQARTAGDRARWRQPVRRCCSAGSTASTTDVVYLSPAPLYHAAPAGWSTGTHRLGGTVVVMERFDPLEWLRLIEEHKVTHTQMVPTYLDPPVEARPRQTRSRYDLSSLQDGVHAAAPCPPEVKRGVDRLARPDRLRVLRRAARAPASARSAHRSGSTIPARSASRCSVACTSSMRTATSLPIGEEGEIWFEALHRFDYHGDPEKTAQRVQRQGLELDRRHRTRSTTRATST